MEKKKGTHTLEGVDYNPMPHAEVDGVTRQFSIPNEDVPMKLWALHYGFSAYFKVIFFYQRVSRLST